MTWTPPADGRCASVGALNPPRARETSVTTLTIIGLDIAKSSFQIHGVAACGLWQFVPEQAPGKCVPRLPQVFSRITRAVGSKFHGTVCRHASFDATRGCARDHGS
jgi:hypothetical protein